jgi:hypothetical protein
MTQNVTSRKKAQVKFGETIGVLFIVYFLIMIGLVWYNSSNSSDLKELSQKKVEAEVFQKQTFLLHSSLLKSSNFNEKENYVDEITLKAFYNFSKTENGTEFLKDKLGNALVTIQIFSYDEIKNINDINQRDKNVSSFNDQDHVLVVYNYSLFPIEESRNSLKAISTFPIQTIEGKKKIGVLTLWSYSK